MSVTTRISREELYQLVWSQPISKLAPKFGVSDTAISKICRKLDIPRPPRGYWARLAHGYPVTQPSLPKLKKGVPTIYDLSPPSRPIRKIDKPGQPTPTVTVKSRVSRYHPVISRLRSELVDSWQDQYGRIRTRRKVSVSKASLSRAYRLLDALIHALEERDIHTTLGEYGLQFWVEEEDIRLELHEPAKRQKPKMQNEYGYPLWEYVPTGKLTLTLWSRYLSDYPSTWSDSKRGKLEDHLGEVVGVFEALPETICLAKAEEYRRQLRREREKLCRRRRSDVYRYTRARAKHLDSLAENLEKARLIRALVEAVECALEAPAATRRLARWARLYADHLDPLVDVQVENLLEQPLLR